jgi:hypothetical protein
LETGRVVTVCSGSTRLETDQASRCLIGEISVSYGRQINDDRFLPNP